MRTISELLKQLHVNEDVISTFLLGYLYGNSELVPQNRHKAFEFYRKAAIMDVPEDNRLAIKYKIEAGLNAWVMYLSGCGVLEDKQQGINWVIKAAETKCAHALYHLGNIYKHGDKYGVGINYNKAFTCYLKAAFRGHVDAKLSVGAMYFAGLGVSKNIEKATMWFQRAKDGGNSKAKYYLQKDWLSIWPNEEWVTKEACGSIGQVFGATSGMTKVQQFVEQYKLLNSNIRSSETKRFDIDPNLEFWIEMVARRDVSEGHYAVGKYALAEIRKLKSGIGPVLLSKYCIKNILSPQDMKDKSWLTYALGYSPLNSSMIKRMNAFVVHYVRAKVGLTRALEGGIVEAKDALLSLEEYKEDIEVLLANTFTDYMAKAQKDELLLKAVEEIIRPHRLSRDEESTGISTVPNENLKSLLSRFITEGNIEEFRTWIPFVIDEVEYGELCKSFFNHAIKSQKLDIAKEFLSLELFDLNYIIQGIDISPLELLIEQGELDIVKEILERKDVDVNYNNLLFRAATKGMLDAVEILLSHPDIKVNSSQKFKGKQLTAREVAVLCGHTVIVNAIDEYERKNLNLSKNSSEITGFLYFQYRAIDVPYDNEDSLVSETEPHEQPQDIAMEYGKSLKV